MFHSFLGFPYLEIIFVNIGLMVSEPVKGKGRDRNSVVRGAKNFHIIINKKNNWTFSEYLVRIRQLVLEPVRVRGYVWVLGGRGL